MSGDPAWMADAACRAEGVDPAVFFPDNALNGGADQAKKICSGCPVTDECLTFALDHRIRDGIWGGQSVETERRRRNAARRKELAAERRLAEAIQESTCGLSDPNTWPETERARAVEEGWIRPVEAGS